MDNKKIFEVIVVATMSAGKSTVINALIGQELLHSANEAATATIIRIHDKDHLKGFQGTAYGYQNEQLDIKENIDTATLNAWNADTMVKTIDLIGDMRAISNNRHAEIVIYDTPGPNNSQDDNHETLTMEVVNDGNYGLILYVLNATQLGTQDDRNLLESVQQTLKNDDHKKILFLLNKSDKLDEEKGESVQNAIANATKYLNNIGFDNPEIVPVSAYFALLAKKALHKQSLTRSEFADLSYNINDMDNRFIESAVVPMNVKNKLSKKMKNISNKRSFAIRGKYFSVASLKALNAKSGFGLVKIILQKYL
ncbi:MAG: dynamin family protein [Moraxella sp.]|nr:dynamin family protein [Moraxella sp.]